MDLQTGQFLKTLEQQFSCAYPLKTFFKTITADKKTFEPQLKVNCAELPSQWLMNTPMYYQFTLC